MKTSLKRIIRESIDEFGWVEDLPILPRDWVIHNDLGIEERLPLEEWLYSNGYTWVGGSIEEYLHYPTWFYFNENHNTFNGYRVWNDNLQHKKDRGYVLLKWSSLKKIS